MLLDVRTEAEVAVSTFSGPFQVLAVPIITRLQSGDSPAVENGAFAAEARAALGGRTRVVVACQRGRRGANAAEIMGREGKYDTLLNIEGGFLAWQAAGLPTGPLKPLPDKAVDDTQAVDVTPRGPAIPRRKFNYN